jgi:hypothetical protein
MLKIKIQKNIFSEYLEEKISLFPHYKKSKIKFSFLIKGKVSLQKKSNNKKIYFI